MGPRADESSRTRKGSSFQAQSQNVPGNMGPDPQYQVRGGTALGLQHGPAVHSPTYELPRTAASVQQPRGRTGWRGSSTGDRGVATQSATRACSGQWKTANTWPYAASL